MKPHQSPSIEQCGGMVKEALRRSGDEPSVVGRAIVAAATDKRPKLRYPAGSLARRVSKARRYVPAAIFDKQIRKINQLNRPASTTVSSPERKASNGQPMSLQAPQAGSHRQQAGGEGL
jgi:hypothetical protein